MLSSVYVHRHPHRLPVSQPATPGQIMASSRPRSPTVKPEHAAPSELIAQDQPNMATKFGEASTVFEPSPHEGEHVVCVP